MNPELERKVEEFRSAFKDPKGDYWLDDFNSDPSNVEAWFRTALTEAFELGRKEERERIKNIVTTEFKKAREEV